MIFAGSEGKQLLADITKAKLESDHRRLEESRSKIQGQRAKSMPEEERAKIKAAIANATTLEEIQRLERQLRV